MYTVIAFYKFVNVQCEIEELRQQVKHFCKSHNILGTILLATEGINGTIAGKKEDIESFVEYIRAIKYFDDLSFQTSYAEENPFEKMKVRVKHEIVRLNYDQIKVSHNGDCGKYIESEDWVDFIDKNNALVIDTRNPYEHKIGHFNNSVCSDTESFQGFVKWFDEFSKTIDKNKTICMCCTGGIRCEKAVGYVEHKGFKNVYHLKSGILGYLKNTGNVSKKWQGACFVFDNRIAVDDNLKPYKGIRCSKCNSIPKDSLRNITKGFVICSDCEKKHEGQDIAKLLSV